MIICKKRETLYISFYLIVSKDHRKRDLNICDKSPII